MTVELEPVYVDDRDGLASWHNQTVYLLFEYAVEHAGLMHSPHGFSWPKPACPECGCGSDGGCWYCALKEAA